MSPKEAILAALKELVLPELAELKAGLATANQRLDGTDKRLESISAWMITTPTWWARVSVLTILTSGSMILTKV